LEKERGDWGMTITNEEIRLLLDAIDNRKQNLHDMWKWSNSGSMKEEYKMEFEKYQKLRMKVWGMRKEE
jgi:hypothetical protein